ncbi:MAG: M16 family metallopeptidase [Myxococcota bacterium]
MGHSVHKTGEHVFGEIRVERYKLHNGLTVIIWEDHRAPVFSYQTWFGVGSRHEQPGRTGMAHLFEHLMFKATKTMAEGEFDRVMEAAGAQTNAATWVDWTYYREKLPAGSLDLVCKLESDRMENMILNHDQLESEREVVVNERLLRVDNDPDGTLYERLYKIAYGDHPYSWPTIGWMEDIRAITLEDCFDFYRRYYAPNNATVVVVGDVETDEVLRVIESYYGHLKAQELPDAGTPAEVTPSGPHRAELELELSAERGIYGWHAVSGVDDDHAALQILDEVLTGGESSRLYKRLVIEDELATSCGGWIPAWRYPGLYEFGVHMRPDHTFAEAEVVIDEVITKVLEEGITERELLKAKNSLEVNFWRQLSDTGNRATALGDNAVTSGDIDRFFGRVEALRKVTCDDVQRVARRILVPERLACVLGRPMTQGAN